MFSTLPTSTAAPLSTTDVKERNRPSWQAVFVVRVCIALLALWLIGSTGNATVIGTSILPT